MSQPHPDPFSETRECNCYRRVREVGVASASAGGRSFAYCRECLHENAELVTVLMLIIDQGLPLFPYKVWDGERYIPATQWFEEHPYAANSQY